MSNLSLTSVDNRVADVERVVAKLVEEFYRDPVVDPAKMFASGGFINGPGEALERENRGLKAHVEQLRSVLDLKDARIAEAESTELVLRTKLENMELARDDALRDAEYWQSESASSDDFASRIQSQLDDLRSKIAGLL